MPCAVVRHREDAATFHARPLPDPVRREVWVCESVGTSLVLGSAQRYEVVDRAACLGAGVAVARRRSGGGAVLVAPGSLLWVDVLLPADDPLWEPDVGRAFLWLGETWAAALADLGHATTVHRGALVRSRWSDLACFAGLGPGELTDPAGRKVVGISQRRTRGGARFQCAALGSWHPEALVPLLALTPEDRDAAAAELASAAAGVGDDLDAVLGAFLHRLP
jgi:lipoate---protein ligase